LRLAAPLSPHNAEDATKERRLCVGALIVDAPPSMAAVLDRISKSGGGAAVNA